MTRKTQLLVSGLAVAIGIVMFLSGVLTLAQAPVQVVSPPSAIRCTVTVSTATTIQAVGGSCAAPGAGQSIYITDISFDASAAGIGADAFPTLKYGTGGTCGTGTTVFWGKLSAAAVAISEHFATPIKIPANNEVCWIASTAGSKFVVILGYTAP